MKYVEDCIFCQIAAKKMKAEIQYEDNDIVAFNDVTPKAPIHILIIPRDHIPTVDDLTEKDEKIVGRLIYIAQKIAREKQISDNGYRLIFNVRHHAGQVIDHLHLHLIGGKQLGQMA